MLKISSKQEKIRQFILNKNYQFFVHKIIKLFFVKNRLSPQARYLLDLYNLYYSFSSLSKTRSICFLTGRSRSVYRLFKLSRLKIRTYSKYGYFTGLSKAS